MSEIKTETPTAAEAMSTSEWMNAEFDAGSLKKAAAQGEILPKLDLSAATGGKGVANGNTVNVEFVSGVITKVTSAKFDSGECYFTDVLYQGVKHSIALPTSLGFSLAKIMTTEGKKDLKGMKAVIGAHIQDMKDKTGKVIRKNVKLYWAQKAE